MRAISKRRRECLRSVLLVPATPRQRETGSRDTLRLLQAQQTFPHDEEVRQGAGDDESMGVLRQAAVTHLVNPKTRLITPIECSTLARTRDFWRFVARSARLKTCWRPALRWVKSCAWGAQARSTAACPV